MLPSATKEPSKPAGLFGNEVRPNPLMLGRSLSKGRVPHGDGPKAMDLP